MTSSTVNVSRSYRLRGQSHLPLKQGGGRRCIFSPIRLTLIPLSGHGKARGSIGQNHASPYRPVLKIGIWLLISLFQCLPAGAGEAARVSGTVFTIGADRVRIVWPNARITLTNLGNAIKSMLVSDSLGEYSFGDLIPGEYEIRVDLAGFRTAARQITMPENGDVRMDFQLDPGIPDKTVEVTADATAINHKCL